VIYEGGSRGEAAKTGTLAVRLFGTGCWRSTLWNLLTGQAPGQTSLLSDEHRRTLAAIIDQGLTVSENQVGLAIWRHLPRGGQSRRVGPAEMQHRCNVASSRGNFPGARTGRHHAVVMLNQAGCHQSKKLKVPDNITLLPLPQKCQKLNET